MIDVQTFFTSAEAAKFLRFSPATIATWRSDGRGPKYSKIGGAIRYKRDDLTLWAETDESGRREMEKLFECHQRKWGCTKRPRGRAGAAQRKQRFADEPFCRDCRDRDIIRYATEIDHIVPLSKGGTNDDSNVRALCKLCHNARTTAEFVDVTEPK